MATAPTALVEQLGSHDVDAADAVMCQAMLRDLKCVIGWAEAQRARVTTRLDALARTGESFGSEATHTNCSGMSAREASKQKERAETLGHAAGFGEALADGAVTAEHVDRLAAATSKLPDDVRSSLFDHADELLDHATTHDPARFGRHVRELAARLERQAGIDRNRQQRSNTRLSWRIADDGMYDIHARLHPTLGSRFVTAIEAEVTARVAAGEAAGEPEYVDRTVSRGRLAAEAMVDFVTAGHQLTRPVLADITVICDERTATMGEQHDHTVCETAEGALLPASALAELLCHARLTPMILGRDGNPLYVGRASRTFNRHQRRALRAMYRTCAAHGCETVFGKCEIHHIWEWERGGPTDLDNGVPLCSRHHHLVHELHWRLHLAPDRTLTITDQHAQLVMQTHPDMPRPGKPPTGSARPPAPDRAAPNLLAG